MARGGLMRTIEIKLGTIDIRFEQASDRVCLVFSSADQEVRMYRLMDLAEALAFWEHLGRSLVGKQLKAMGE
jgi:hypothetical protein